MKIDMKQVEYVANLARIALSDEEKRKFAEQLGEIIEYVEKLNELDTENIEPMAHATGLVNVFREDEPKSSLPADKAVENAPEREGNFFRVPRVV